MVASKASKNTCTMLSSCNLSSTEKFWICQPEFSRKVIILNPYLAFLETLFQIVRQIMAYIVLKLFCKVRVESQHVRQTFHIDGL